MPNKNYLKGRRKEYKICDKLKMSGFNIVQRTAGSHSPIDILAIRFNDHKILFIQSNPKRMSKAEKNRIKEKNKFLNGKFNAEFKVI